MTRNNLDKHKTSIPRFLLYQVGLENALFALKTLAVGGECPRHFDLACLGKAESAAKDLRLNLASSSLVVLLSDWLYGPHGHKHQNATNHISNMQPLMGQSKLIPISWPRYHFRRQALGVPFVLCIEPKTGTANRESTTQVGDKGL
jgi:hypothetical protein